MDVLHSLTDELLALEGKRLHWHCNAK